MILANYQCFSNVIRVCSYHRQLYVSLGNRAHYQWLNAFCRQVTRAFRGCSVIAEGNALTVVLISLSLIMNFLMNLCAERCHCDCLVEAVSGVAGSFVSTVTYYELATLRPFICLTLWLQILSKFCNNCRLELLECMRDLAKLSLPYAVVVPGHN